MVAWFNDHKTFLRGVEAFLFVLASSFIAQLTVSGGSIPMDLSVPENQAKLVTAFLAAVGIAFRQWQSTKGQTASL